MVNLLLIHTSATKSRITADFYCVVCFLSRQDRLRLTVAKSSSLKHMVYIGLVYAATSHNRKNINKYYVICTPIRRVKERSDSTN